MEISPQLASMDTILFCSMRKSKMANRIPYAQHAFDLQLLLTPEFYLNQYNADQSMEPWSMQLHKWIISLSEFSTFINKIVGLKVRCKYNRKSMG